MPRLPTVQDFGQRPSVRAPRGIHAIRAGIAESAEAAALRNAPNPLAAVADVVSNVAGVVSGLAERFAIEDAAREATALDTEFSDGIRALQAGYLDLRGEAAITEREAHIVALEKLRDGILAKASPRVRERVTGPFNSRLSSAMDTSARHFGAQRRVARTATYLASQAATADDAAVAGAAGDAEAVVSWAKVAGNKAAVYARQTGADPVLEAEAAITSIFVSEIERRALTDPASARAFFEDSKDSIDGRRHNAIEALLQRAESQAGAELKRSVDDAVAVLDRGRLPSNLAAVQAAAVGSQHATPLAEAVEDRATVRDFMRKPLAEQAAQLRDRPETTTRRALATEDRKRRAHDAMRRDIAAGHGLTVAAELDVIGDVDPVDLSSPASLRLRTIQADVASRHFGVRISPLLPAEADAIGEQIGAAPADQVTGILAGLHAGLGREGALSLVGQLAEKRPELAFAMLNVAERPLLAREIVLGGRLLKENGDVAPGKPDRLEAIAEVFGTEDRSVFTPDTATALAPILDAATALYAARRVPTGDFVYDPDTFETALQDVTGGVFEFNGRNVLAPIPGMTEDAFDDAMDRLTQPDLIEFGNGVPLFGNGDPFTVSMFESSFFGPEGQIVTAGFGRYMVTFPGLGFVMNQDGQPYELDLAAFIRGAP